MKRTKSGSHFFLMGLVVLLLAGCAASIIARDETPGQHFDRVMKEFSANCAKVKLKPNDTACDILKLKPADPLATEEGRFAHSIKIPNPVPEDSGYKQGKHRKNTLIISAELKRMSSSIRRWRMWKGST